MIFLPHYLLTEKCYFSIVIKLFSILFTNEFRRGENLAYLEVEFFVDKNYGICFEEQGFPLPNKALTPDQWQPVLIEAQYIR